jgi:hypothetical protein
MNDMSFDLMELTADQALAEQLQSYFSSLETTKSALVADAAIGLLPLARSFELSQEFRSFHPLIKSLAGIILDDAGTSDHHVLVCVAPLKGLVFHLAHDGDSRIVFENLDAFVAAAERAKETDDYVSDEHPEDPFVADDQVALRNFLSFLRSQDDFDQTVPALVSSLDFSQPEFLIALIGDDMAIGEAVALEIAARPAPGLLPVAEFCERHPHIILRQAGRMARESILAD